MSPSHSSQRSGRLRSYSRSALALFFVLAGANHFRSPEVYISMIPQWLPAPVLLNQISGAAEIAGGCGLLFPQVRKHAATGLILLLIAVFPANLHVAIHGWDGMEIPRWILILRLPFQLLFMAWVAYAADWKPSFSLKRNFGF
ncbi:DoxX family membrane protein [Luteolibacter algae]|uniref:DoxX family membrane protein n=1 Tax=Luteolibacter algae TaxID=454151 RepID=A0ABW5D4P9_9BACT